MMQNKRDTRYLKDLNLPPDGKDPNWYCIRKVRHKSRKAAKRVLIKGRQENHYSTRHQVYKCPFCFGFHIGGR